MKIPFFVSQQVNYSLLWVIRCGMMKDAPVKQAILQRIMGTLPEADHTSYFALKEMSHRGKNASPKKWGIE